MRTFVLILMLALLPLRIWAADGMAVRMAAAELGSGVAAFQTDDSMASMVMSSMPGDCPMMAAKAGSERAESQDPAGKSEHPEQSACVTCQLCAAVPAPFEPELARHALPSARPGPTLHRFASAEPQRELKPPIS